MKYVVLVALSLLVGFLAGAMAKGKEIHEAHEQIAELEEKECRGGGMGRGIFDAMTQRRPSEALELDKSPSPPVEDDVPRDDGASKDDDVTFEFEFGSGKKGEGSRDDGFEDEGFEDESLDAMRTAQDLRRAQARAALLEQTYLSDKEIDSFDTNMDDMNNSLAEVTLELAQDLERGEELTRHEMMLYAADFLDVMIEADYRTMEILGDQFQSVDDQAVDPLSHIDPSLLDLLVDLDQ